MRILVAMSGGVDSSVVAHMLKSEGHEVIGVRFTLWTDPLAPPIASVLPSKCCNAQTIARANRVAQDLKIPLHILDLEAEFKRDVVDPFIEGYKNGETPNPCIGCNRSIKFGKLIELMHELGCEKLATGHYATVCEVDGIYHLQEAADLSKDQSYYLYGLDQEQLACVLFPLGSMLKTEVFTLAETFGVPYEDISYRESQDLCFFPEKEPEDFLRRYITDTKEGPIKTQDGRTVGTHKGMPFYTIGQRKGLNIGGLKIPLHVIKKDPSTNTIYVEEQGKDLTQTLQATDLRWISVVPTPHVTHTFLARIHAHGEKIPVDILHDGTTLDCTLSKGVRGIATGQSIVLYDDTDIVGGGVII